MCRSTTANTMCAEGSRPSEGANTSGKGPKGNKKYRMNLARKTFMFLERALFSQVFYMVSPRKKAGGRTRHLGSNSNSALGLFKIATEKENSFGEANK